LVQSALRVGATTSTTTWKSATIVSTHVAFIIIGTVVVPPTFT
jgi:hypothetical protein